MPAKTYINCFEDAELRNGVAKRGAEEMFLLVPSTEPSFEGYLALIPTDRVCLVMQLSEGHHEAVVNAAADRQWEIADARDYFKHERAILKKRRPKARQCWYDKPHSWDYSPDFQTSILIAKLCYGVLDVLCPSLYIYSVGEADYFAELACHAARLAHATKELAPSITPRYSGGDKAGDFVPKDEQIRRIRVILRYTDDIVNWNAEQYYRRASTFPPTHPDYNNVEVAAARRVHGDTYKLPNGDPNERLIATDARACLLEQLDWVAEARTLGPLPLAA